jgi:tRNA 2-selenouridine synthase
MPVVDVRTPSEYSRGHMPSAINIPLFSDEERAVVGTLYKREGKIKAVRTGLDFIGPKMSKLLGDALSLAGKDNRIALYCWRGGMRSDSMAWLFRQGGLDTYVLDGGYKEYRNHVLNELDTLDNVVVLGGLTGSGKTFILEELSKLGEQVIDLEGLANHRGSAFGSLGMPPQPTSEHFTNLLYDKYSDIDRSVRLFLEDESRNIGAVFMPDNVYNVIRNSPVIAVMTDADTRMPHLMEEYGKFDPALLVTALERISKRMGGDNSKRAIEAVNRGDIRTAIEMVLVYYDKSYRYGLSKRDSKMVTILETVTGNPEENAKKVIKAANRLARKKTG